MRHQLVGQNRGKVKMKQGEFGSPIRRVAVLLLVLAIMFNLLPASLNAASGTADGTYDFGDNLGANNSGGSGFKKQGDKFVVTNGFAKEGTSLWSEHLQSSNTTGELVIKAEGQNVLGSFTFRDLGISGYSNLTSPSLDLLTLTLKDAGGAEIATHSNTGNVNLREDNVNKKFQISTLLGNGASYNYSNVASVTLQWRFANSLAPSNLNIDDITLTNMISPIPQDTPTFNPAAGAVAFGTALEIVSAGADHIYYTTDGSTPATAVSGSTLEYNAAAKPTISAAMTVKAIATKIGKSNSSVGSVSYTQAPTANLTGLALSGSPSGFTFAGGTYTYNGVTVASGVASIMVTPSGAGTLTVDGATVASGAVSSAIMLTPGVERTITVVATETGKSAKTYVIKVTREQETQATPTFNPAAGAVALGTELEILSAGADHIYYTTDGSTPATAVGGSTLEYNASAKPTISAAVTVKAIATKTNNLDSAIASASYTQAATANLTGLALSGSPSGFVFAGGTYAYNGVTVASGVASVTVTPSGTGTLTVDGTTVASGVASSAITLTPGVERTITVVATETGKSAKTYVIKVTREQVAQATPTFNPTAGAVAFGTELEIVSAGADHIYYTTDGSTPATAVGGSTLEYNAAAKPTISAAVTVKAIATKTDNLDSAVASASYTQAATANLTDVELSGAPSGFVFAGGTYEYNGVTVVNGVASVTVTPSGTGTLTVDGTTVASGVASSAITLTPGVERTITVVATETGKSAKTYVIKVTREKVAQATPTFNPVAGAVAFGTELEIISAGADHIYYTTDGSTPATAVGGSTLEYDAAAKPTISAAVTVKAIATKTNNLDSAVGSASYTQAATANLTDVELSGTPSGFVFAGGTYAYNGVTVANGVASVMVTPSGTGTLTVDGTTVTSGVASSAITLTPGVERTITVVATETGKSAKTYVIKVTREQVAQETPTFNPAAGAVAFGTELEIISAGADHIYYTTDGSTPATAVGGSTLEYDAAAKPTISAAVTVKAIATKTNNLDSAVGSASYTQAATANLTDVELSGTPSGFVFAGGTYAYNGVTVANGVASVMVTPSGTGTLTVDGTTVTSGVASSAITLTPGVERTITVVATETGKSAKTYVIKVTREKVAQETPTFNPAAGAVAFGTELEILSAGADHIYYTTDGSTPATAISGSTLEYNAAAKPVINSAITVKAIATKADYFDSDVESVSYTQAEAADLTNLVLSDSPSGFGFASGTYDYIGLTVPYNVSTLTVTPSGSGTIKVDGSTVTSGIASPPISLNAGSEQTVTIVVEEAGKLSKTYTVKVTRLNIHTPGVPTGVAAAHGNAQAVVSFTAPVDNGGSPVKGYEVTAMPGNVTVSGISSPITVTGLTNGTSYTFTVKALNIAGSSAASTQSNAITPTAPSSGGSSGGSTSNPNTPTNKSINVLINGIVYNIGSTSTAMVNNQSVTTLSVNQEALKGRLANEASGVVVTFPVDIQSGALIVKLNGDNVKALEQKQALVKIQTGSATYTLPIEQITGSQVIRELLQQTGLEQLEFQIELAALTPSRLQEVKSAAAKGGFELIGEPFDFTVRVVNGATRQEIAKFNTYVEREIAIPSTVDPQRITTAIVIEADGSIRHVPTKVVQANGSYWAKIYSLTNSTYALVWNPVEFQDAAGHWAQQAINDMGSRMVISGVGGDRFNPNASITRAEFAAIIVRGLGLKLETGASGFSDVQTSAWYNQAIQTAVAYKLINGFEDGTFRPNEPITREQATVIIAKAMAITGLKAGLSAANADDILLPYADANEAAAWARSSLADSLQGGVISGRSGAQLAPKAFITRAEIAVMVQRLLANSKLI
ncbi:cadherin-like beta sandwich domain-containing protein [Paenibacillus sp. FSL H8-0537]|uniref:cadherin-like beta sandwich domain-containing protein n=1 Tax=Paenibacillus sp. FSL H8-0537 TaxID=2921399 RepID=UPI003101B024